jgi:thiol-disulfide isomerase/thioredoxin
MIAVAVGIAAALGVLMQRHLQPTAPTASLASTPTLAATAPPVAPQALAPSTEAATPKVPESLPGFVLGDRDGKPRRLGEWRGRPLLVNYWATWCAPCRREIPLLNAVRKQRNKQRLEVIGIAVDFRDDVLEYAKSTVIDYPLLIGEEDGLAAVQAVGMQPAFPFSVFADSQQRIVTLKVGELHQDEVDLILDRVAAIDAGKLALDAARKQITEGLKALSTARAIKTVH